MSDDEKGVEEASKRVSEEGRQVSEAGRCRVGCILARGGSRGKSKYSSVDQSRIALMQLCLPSNPDILRAAYALSHSACRDERNITNHVKWQFLLGGVMAVAGHAMILGLQNVLGMRRGRTGTESRASRGAGTCGGAVKLDCRVAFRRCHAPVTCQRQPSILPSPIPIPRTPRLPKWAMSPCFLFDRRQRTCPVQSRDPASRSQHPSAQSAVHCPISSALPS
ncbi:hypothetical protein DFH27DRAFT_204832 [Peziza echinospora]|nr:hypothetical protein DFH27DRAFT_204832 [Peziza echinospora]